MDRKNPPLVQAPYFRTCATLVYEARAGFQSMSSNGSQGLKAFGHSGLGSFVHGSSRVQEPDLNCCKKETPVCTIYPKYSNLTISNPA